LDDPKKVPLVFANRVIRQIADHLLGTDLVIEPKDFLILRLVFRHLGGTWVSLIQGDIEQLKILERVITRWGKMSERKRDNPDA
jgi:hypothetical protein